MQDDVTGNGEEFMEQNRQMRSMQCAATSAVVGVLQSTVVTVCADLMYISDFFKKCGMQFLLN